MALRSNLLKGKKDTQLGQILAGLQESAGQRFAQRVGVTPQAATPQQRVDWTSRVSRELAPKIGGRGFVSIGEKNTVAGNPRAGQQARTFVKRADDGNIYKYHQYTQNGKRKVFRVGGPLNKG